MYRLFSEIKTNMLVQYRNGLYHIGIGVGIIIAIAMSQLVNIEYLPLWMAGIMLLVVGGSTFLYAAAMVLFERDEGTITATLISPLTSNQYIIGKIVSLILLASLEAIIMLSGALIILYFMGFTIEMPNLFVLISASFLICIIFVQTGMIMIVRCRKITNFFMPMLVVIIFLQTPIFYFTGLTDHWALLLFPVLPPTMLVLGAFDNLVIWQYVYALGGSLLYITGLGYWANKAFIKHIEGHI
ncbi:MAG: hypothetical protein HRU28_18785 [Rhizobiales bacterium]|nr:hypothetical protein [Hyphomicrobiales bacterium]